MKTFAVWLLVTWNSNQGIVIQQPYFPTFQECENVRKTVDELTASARTKCVRTDILQLTK